MTTYRGRFGAANGGGYNNCGAVDTLIAGHYIAGGDVWGCKFTLNSGNEWFSANWGYTTSFPNTRSCYVSKRSQTAGMALYGTGTYNNTASNGNGELAATDFSNPFKIIMVDPANGFGSFGFGHGAGNTVADCSKRPVGHLIDSQLVSGTEYIYTITSVGAFRYTSAGTSASQISGPTQIATPSEMTNSNMFTTICCLDDDNIIVVSYDRTGNGGTTEPPQHNTVMYLLQPTSNHMHSVTGASQVSVTPIAQPNGVNHVYELHRGYDGTLYASCGTDGFFSMTLSGTTPTWHLVANSDNFAASADCAANGVFWGGQSGGDASNNNQQNMVAGHAAFKSNAAQSVFTYPAAAAGAIHANEFKVGDGATGTGRLWWLRADNRSFDGPAYDCSVMRIDPFDNNKVIFFGRAGAWMTRNGGTGFYPVMNGFTGVETHNVKTTGPTSVSSDGVDAPHESHSSDDYQTAIAGTSYSGGGQTLPTTGSITITGDDNLKYTFTAPTSSAPAKLSRSDIGDISTDEFRGAIAHQTGIAVTQDHAVYISMYGGGVYVMEPQSGTRLPAAPIISSFSPSTAAVAGTVIVSGSNFQNGTVTAGTVNTTAVVTLSVVDDATVNIVVPSGATSGLIRLVNPQGVGVSGSALQIGTATPPAVPHIGGFSPASGQVGDVISVSGTALGTATLKVGGANGVAATPSTNSNISIVFPIPSGASSGPLWVSTAGGTALSSSDLTVTSPPPPGGPVIQNLPQGVLSRTATMQIRSGWTTDAQATQVAAECVLISGPPNMSRLAMMMTTNPSLIPVLYVKSIQDPVASDSSGTKYPAQWYCKLKDGTKAQQTGTFVNWVMESGNHAVAQHAGTVTGELSGNRIVASSWAEYHVKDSLQSVAQINAQPVQQGAMPFRGLFLDSMSTFSADNVPGFWLANNPGWNPQTSSAYGTAAFRAMAYYVGDMARGAIVNNINPNNYWMLANGLREAGISSHADMAMSEGWLVSSATVPSYTGAQFEAKLQLLLDCQANGAVAQILEWGYAGDSAAITNQRRRLAAASLLMAHRGIATFEFSTLKSTGPWLETANDTALYSLNLGNPSNGQSPASASGHAVAVGGSNGQASAAGLYARLYTDGTLLVNPTTSTITYKATRSYNELPYPGAGGNSYGTGNVITVNAQSAMILTAAVSGFSAPTNVDLPYILNSSREGETLTLDEGNWTANPDPTFSNQWQQSASGTAGWIDIAGQVALSFAISFGVTTPGTVATDDYAGTVAAGWGTATTGQIYAIAIGTATDFSRTGGFGNISCPGANTSRFMSLPVGLADLDLSWDVDFPGTAAGGNLQASECVRFQDVNNFYDLNAVYSATAKTISVTPRSVINGTAASLGSPKALGTVPTTDLVHLRFSLNGNHIQGRAWSGTAAQPGTWDWDFNDSSISAAGDIAARVFRGNSNSNSGPQAKFDNLLLQAPAISASSYVGQYIKAKVVAGNAAGSATVSSAAVGPVTAGTASQPIWSVLPKITGAAAELSTLTVLPGTLGGNPNPTVALQWQTSADGASSGWSDVSGGTVTTQSIPGGAAGSWYRARVRGSNSSGTVDAYASRVQISAGDAPPQFIVDPTISGSAVATYLLTANLGDASGTPVPTITGQWQESPDAGLTWSDIAGAINTTYLLRGADVGDLVRIQATAANRAGTAIDWSAPVGPIQYPQQFPDFLLEATIE